MLLQNNTLKELNLSKCSLQGKNFVVFCNSIRLDAPLTYLNLSYNDIGDKGAWFGHQVENNPNLSGHQLEQHSCRRGSDLG